MNDSYLQEKISKYVSFLTGNLITTGVKEREMLKQYQISIYLHNSTKYSYNILGKFISNNYKDQNQVKSIANKDYIQNLEILMITPCQPAITCSKSVVKVVKKQL